MTSRMRRQVVHDCHQLVLQGVELSPATSATFVFSCHHLSWNPTQTADDKSKKGEDDIKSACPLCLGDTCYNG